MLWETLSKQEEKVAELLCEGYNTPEIARRTGQSRRMVKHYVANMVRNFQLADSKTHHLRICLAVALVYDRYPEIVPEGYINASAR